MKQNSYLSNSVFKGVEFLGSALSYLGKVETDIAGIDAEKFSEEDIKIESDKIRKEFVSYISTLFKKMSLELKFYESQIANDILFAVIALCDEVLIEKEWFGKKNWQNFPLEKNFFDSISAGDLFYEKIEKIIASTDYKYSEVAHVYYLCMCCGFEGKYHLDADKVKQEIVKQRLFEFYSNWLTLKNEKLDISLKPKNKEFKKLSSIMDFGINGKKLILINFLLFVIFVMVYGIFWDIFVFILKRQML